MTADRIAALEERVAYVEQLMRELVPGEPRIIVDGPFAMIMADVAQATSVSRYELISPARTNRVVRARTILIWVVWKAHPDYSSLRIGELLGNRDHSTILAARTRADEMRASDPAYRELTDRLLAAALTRKSA